jgi:hypothetical protein
MGRLKKSWKKITKEVGENEDFNGLEGMGSRRAEAGSPEGY